jgi:tetratricopeptide (TPR) repeat protein
MSGGPHRKGTVLATTVLLAAALAGCRREAGPEVLQQAWKFAAARMFDEALPLVKEYLVWHPEDAAAHYVLGNCYLHQKEVNTTLARGEFETAMRHFEKRRELGVLAAEMTAELFQSTLHRETALALMRALYEGNGKGIPANMMYPVLDQALQEVREGLRFDPSSGFLKDMESSLEELRQGRPAPTPLPEPADKAGRKAGASGTEGTTI